MKYITFYTHYPNQEYRFHLSTTYNGTKILMKNEDNVHTTQICLLSFDLLEQFGKIFLDINGAKHELKLGKNTWTAKELRVSHNLFKLVQSNFLNDL